MVKFILPVKVFLVIALVRALSKASSINFMKKLKHQQSQPKRPKKPGLVRLTPPEQELDQALAEAKLGDATLAKHLEQRHLGGMSALIHDVSPTIRIRLVKSLNQELKKPRPNLKVLQNLTKGLSAPDLATILQLLSSKQRLVFMQLMIEHLNPEVLTKLDDDILEDILPQLPAKFWQGLLKKLESDDVLDLIELFDERQQNKLLAFVSPQDRAQYHYVLNLPENTAGRLMRHELVTAPKFWTVGQMIDYMRDKKHKLPEQFHNIIIVGAAHRPVGVLPLAKLLRANRPTPLAKLMQKEFIEIPLQMNHDKVAKIFARYGLTEAPVVDEAFRLVGSITVDDVVEVLQEEHAEDIFALGGVRDGDFYKSAFATSLFRFTWLFINLLTAIFASMVIGLFSTTIDQLVALAILMPIVPSMGGNAGTQTTTVIIRALATGDLVSSNTLRTLWKETAVGWLNGLFFAIIVGVMVYIWQDSALMGVTIGLSLIITLLAAGLFGVLIPVVLKKLRYDPAISSSIFLTWVTDTVGFFSFLAIAAWLLL